MSIGCVSCGNPDISVVFYVHEGYTFSRSEQQTIETIAAEAMRDAERLLPSLPDRIIVRVNPGKKVMPETGQTGSISRPNVVYWMVDPGRNGGVTAIAKRQLRSTLLHEFHHLVRESTDSPTPIMARVLDEGLATVFERDFGDAPTPWGAYPPEVADWVTELLALPVDASQSDWMSRHPDGRRWIGYKAGTYLVDQAVRASGKSALELISMSTEDLLAIALKGVHGKVRNEAVGRTDQVGLALLRDFQRSTV